MRVIGDLIFVCLFTIGLFHTVNSVGISSKLDFDDDPEPVSVVKHEKIKSHITLTSSPHHGSIKGTKPAELVIEDLFNEDAKNDKIKHAVPAAVKCDSSRELCELTAENVSKDDDIVLTNVNVKVVTKVHGKDKDKDNSGPIEIADVPILQENQGHTFDSHPNINNNIPTFIPNTPIVHGNDFSTARNSGFRPVIPIQATLINSDPTYHHRHFGENPPPNAIWTSRNINTNPQNPKAFYNNGYNKHVYETPDGKRISTSITNPNTWFYPISNPVIPTRSTPADYNNNFHDISSLLAPPSEKNYPGNLFTNINYPESNGPSYHNTHQSMDGLICNCVRDHTGRSHEQPFRTPFEDQPKKIKGIDDKLDKLN